MDKKVYIMVIETKCGRIKKEKIEKELNNYNREVELFETNEISIIKNKKDD